MGKGIEANEKKLKKSDEKFLQHFIICRAERCLKEERFTQLRAFC
jgi:hypothetical protein